MATAHPGPARPPGRRWWVWPPVLLAVLVPLVTGTVVSFVLMFGITTACTSNHSCTYTSCAPCRTTGNWLNAGWVGQAVLFVAAIVLLILTARGRRNALPIALAGAVIIVASIAVESVTAIIASGSY